MKDALVGKKTFEISFASDATGQVFDFQTRVNQEDVPVSLGEPAACGLFEKRALLARSAR